jgi:UDP-N-acetylmuramoyl-tripeptide--D-alanyl-D-alanine ligase
MLELLGKRVYATKGNYNNHLGLPLTILNAPDDVDFIVLELGMNHSGEIAELTKTADPDISVINNIGTAHIGNFSSQNDLAAAKLEIFDNTESIIIADMDDPFINKWVTANKNKKVVQYHSEDAKRIYDIFSDQPKYMIDNLFCAENVVKAAVGKLPDRQKVLSNLSLPAMRGEKKVIGKREFVVDCYNANPESMRRSIDEFFEKYGKENNKKLYLILGSMFELGEFSKKLHRELVNYIKKVNLLERAFLVGYEFEKVRSDFLNEKKVIFSGDVPGLLDVIPPVGTFLLKGSRGNKLERILDYLEKEK